MPILEKFYLNQKGVIPPLALVIVTVIVIGSVYSFSQQTKNNQTTSPATKNTQSEWKTYTDQKYGYTIKYPPQWTIENLDSNDTGSIRMTNPNKSVFVLIDFIIGPSLEKAGEMEKVVDLLENKLRKNTSLKINEFTKSIAQQKDTSGYTATGEETYNEKTVLFEERFVVSTNGRGLRMHSIYASDSKDINKPITQEIMGSFKEQTPENTPIKGVPAPVSEFLNNKDITKLETGGLSINKGNSPPNVEGTYKADNFIATYVSLVQKGTTKVGDTISKGTGAVVAFSNQKDDGSISIDGDSAEGFESRSTSISGKDNCFTIYVEENFNKSNCKYVLAFVESGCKVDKGLENFQISSLMKSKKGEGCDDLAPVGYTIVGKEEDGLLERMVLDK